MDLNFKSPRWVGSIYHKFEAICQEVDDFVSQETVKYVENQAQVVGGSVKRFYSSVVQDLLPSSLTQPGKHEAQLLSLEQKEKDGTYISGSEIKDLEHNKSNVVLGENYLKGGLTDKKSDTFFEENGPNVGPLSKTPYTFEESELEEDWMNTITISVEASYPKIEPSWPKENEEWMKTNANNVEENDLKKEPSSPKEKEEWMNTNISNLEENDPEEEPSQPKEMDLFYPEKASLLSETKIEVTCDTFICDTERILDLSNSLPPSEMNFSVVSDDNKTIESELFSSNSPLSSDMVDVPHNEENICDYLVDETESASDPSDAISSSQPLDIVFCDDTDMKLALSSSTFDEDVPSADDIASLVASFEDNPCKDYAHLEALMSFLKVDEEGDCMVDIELSDDKEKLDESCIHVENKLLYAVFCRSKKHKSFKKILQDAFASRKRLRKEYEQLGILLGDIDIDPPNQLQGGNFLPKIPSSSLELENLSSSDLSEWELL